MELKHIKQTILCVICLLSIFVINSTSVFAQDQQISIVIDRIITTDFPNIDIWFSLYENTGLSITGVGSSDFSVMEDQTQILDFEYFETFDKETPLSIALLVDTSGSMVEGEERSLDEVVSAAKVFVNNLEPDDSIGVISFSEVVNVEQELTIEKTIVINALDNLNDGANSSLYDAVFEGVELLKHSEKKKAIILITDGIDSQTSNHSMEEVIHYAAECHIPIYSIGFGKSLLSEGVVIKESTMDEMADSTGGFAQIYPDSSSIGSALDTVYQMIRRISHISYESSLPADNSQHQLSIQFEFSGNSYSEAGNFIPNPISLSIEAPHQDELLSIDTPITVKASSSSRIDYVQIFIDDEDYQTLYYPTRDENIYEITWNLIDVEPGEHRINIEVVDVIGNIKEANVSVSVREPIQVQIINPIENETLYVQPKIEVNINSILEIASGTMFLNGEEVTTFTSSSFEQLWPQEAFERGVYEISVEVTDIEGHVGIEEIEVRVGDAPIGSEIDEEASPLSGKTLLFIFGGGGLFLAFLLILLPNLLMKKDQKGNDKEKPKPSPSHKSQRISEISGQYILKEISGINPGREWPLIKNEIRLGRNKNDNDIPLKGLNASRRMGLLRKTESTFILHLLNPHNPMIINNQPLTQQVLLNPGDEIKMGESIFKFLLKGE